MWKPHFSALDRHRASGRTPSRRPGAMGYWRSLRGRLSLVFLLLFTTIVLLGVVSVWSLSNSNEVSTDVRDRWLPNTRFLGDINNFSSDYRTAEADSLLAANATDFANALQDIEELDQAVLTAQRGYEQVGHAGEEAELYRQFSSTWAAYKKLADQVTLLLSEGHHAEAAALYRTQSRKTYDAASDLLGRLTDYNSTRAAQASERSVLAYQRARWLTFGALLAAGIMLIAVTSQVRRSISGPLLDLSQAMHKLATNDTAIEIGHTIRADEIGEMARAVVVFRGNAIELVQSQRGLAQQATMLEEKLAHEQYLTQLQRSFVSMIMHEFRTPLMHIDAQAQRLINLRDRLRGEDIDERSNRIRAAVLRIVRLIDHLVDTSRVMDGDAKLFFHPEPTDLATVLRDTCRLHREISPGAKIVEDYGSLSLQIHGDPKLLSQAFGNLISNAIKYSPAGADVGLRARQTGTETIVTVEDRGMGIPEGDKANIFTRYYRGSNVSGLVGTGIGLFLVSTVVHLHGGEVGVESTEGKGSCFVVTLPKGGASPATRSQVACSEIAVTEVAGQIQAGR